MRCGAEASVDTVLEAAGALKYGEVVGVRFKEVVWDESPGPLRGGGEGGDAEQIRVRHQKD